MTRNDNLKHMQAILWFLCNANLQVKSCVHIGEQGTLKRGDAYNNTHARDIVLVNYETLK